MKALLARISAFTLRMLRNRNFILISAVVFGLAVGKPGATITQPSVLPLLALVMTLSILNITSRELVSMRQMPKTIASSVLLSFVILGGLILLLARWLIDEPDLWTGFVVLAAAPPAPGIIAFTYSLGGNTRFSLIGVAGSHLVALLTVPASLLLFLGVQSFDVLRLLTILGELVILPIVLSRIMVFLNLVRYVEKRRGAMVDWSLFVIVFTLIGLNRQAFLGDFHVLIRIAAIAVAISFVLGLVLELACKTLRVSRETSVSVVLMGTAKNYSLAGGLAISVSSEQAAIPASVCLVLALLFITWLGIRMKTRGQT